MPRLRLEDSDELFAEEFVVALVLRLNDDSGYSVSCDSCLLGIKREPFLALPFRSLSWMDADSAVHFSTRYQTSFSIDHVSIHE